MNSKQNITRSGRRFKPAFLMHIGAWGSAVLFVLLAMCDAVNFALSPGAKHTSHIIESGIKVVPVVGTICAFGAVWKSVTLVGKLSASLPLFLYMTWAYFVFWAG